MTQLTLFNLDEIELKDPLITIQYTDHPYNKKGYKDLTQTKTWIETKPKSIIDWWIKEKIVKNYIIITHK